MTEARFDEVLRVIVDGIEHGVFPCSLDPPGSWARTWRTYADPDVWGTRDRYRDGCASAARPSSPPTSRSQSPRIDASRPTSPRRAS